MKRLGELYLALVFLGLVSVVAADLLYVSKLEAEFRELETKRIATSNKLATAKIVYENLHHVRDLVFKNMDFPGNADSTGHETHFFHFLTTCVNDLKLKLVKLEPVEPVTVDRVTTYGYDMEIEGDFFTFGELCAKFENSRRIVVLETFRVQLLKDSSGRSVRNAGHKGIRVTMRVNTYRVRKSPTAAETSWD